MKLTILLITILVLMTGAQAACNDCTLKITPIANNLCQGDSAVYELKLTNIYDQPKAISLSVVGDIPIATNMPSQVIVDPYSSKKIEATFTALENQIGQHWLTITAAGYGAEDSDDALYTINDCYSADLVIESDLKLCQTAKGRVDFQVTNNGQKDDTYTVSVSNIPDEIDVSFIGNTMTLASGETRSGSLTINSLSDKFANYELQLNVQSSLKTVSRPFNIQVADCYRTIVDAPEEFTTCPGAGLSYTATIENKGCVDGDYTLLLSGTCTGRLSTDNLHIALGEQAQVTVILDPNNGECEATLTAVTAQDSESATTQVNILACYDVDLEVNPPELNVCHGQPVTFDLNVTNTGYYDDVYDLSLYGVDIALERNTLPIKSGETDVVSFDLSGTWCVEGDIPFNARAVGHASDADEGYLSFSLTGDNCADITLSPAQDPIQIDCFGDSYTFYVKNTGYTTEKIELTLDGPEEYVLQPSSLTLLATESRPVALYILPTGEELDEVQKITITADTGSKKSYLELDVDLTGAVCTVQRPVLELLEIPELPDDQNSNASSTPTGAVVSEAEIDSTIILAILLVISSVVLLYFVLATPKKPVQQTLLANSATASNEDRMTAIKEAIEKSQK